MKNKNLLLLIPLILVIIAVLFLLIHSCSPTKEVFTGTFETTVVDVASEIPGRIDTIFVDRGDMVTKGELLATIHPNIMNAKLGQAQGCIAGSSGACGKS